MGIVYSISPYVNQFPPKNLYVHGTALGAPTVIGGVR